jgi:exodeoxyribonuclease VIII
MANERIVTERDAFAFGTAFHSLLLEPDGFGDNYGVLPELNLRTKADQAKADAIIAAEPDKLWLTEKASRILNAMAAGALEHPKVFELLGEDADTEVSVYGMRGKWPTKARFDMVLGLRDPDAPLVIVDLKTTRDASPEAFRESVVEYGYHAQEVWYRQELEAVTGREVADFLFIVVEKAWPYHAGVYRLHPSMRIGGQALITDAWEAYLRCAESGEWPHYGNGEVMEL